MPFISDGGFMLGSDCVPSPCSSCACGSLLTDSVLEDDGHFIMRTYAGAVLRKRKALVCKCGNKLSWNPTAEYIHTIYHGTEGGA